MTVPPEGSPRRDRRSRLTARFLLAAGEEVGGNDMTPAALARAAVRVLPIEGAGLSTTSDVLRTPLGSSGADAAKAEVLQTTLGEGPCLDAAQQQTSVVFDLPALREHWPRYAEKLIAETPFRAVASVPLHAPGHVVFAALDLYTTSSRLSDRLDLVELNQGLAGLAAALLMTCTEDLIDVDDLSAQPEWYETAAGRRHNVWVAIGMIMANRSTSGRSGPGRDALTVLRAEAQSRDRSLDDLATDVVDGRLPPPASND